MAALKKLLEESKRKRDSLDEKVLKGRKFIKRSELERLETSQTDEESAEHPVAGGGTTPTGKKPGKHVLLSPTSIAPVEGSPIFSIPKSEVVRRLRERDEPIRLFGETDNDICLRLRQIEILAPEVNKGQRNDFKDALDKIDADYLVQLARQEGVDGASSFDLKVREDNTTIELLQEKFGELGPGEEDDDQRQDLCHKTFRFLMNEWAIDLNNKSLEEKRSYQNKLDLATYRQTESYIAPLLRQLKTKKTTLDILVFMGRICAHLVNREYVQANDAYLSMSIGNAPWPIGVTMVGIHARTGREKIFSQQIAHVLNDETQRKYIQGVKRLMTFCQRKFSTDPSKCVEFNAIRR